LHFIITAIPYHTWLTALKVQVRRTSASTITSSSAIEEVVAGEELDVEVAKELEIVSEEEVELPSSQRIQI
jgi:hypothetical protein